MPSRFWLFLAFVIAFGVKPAHSEPGGLDGTRDRAMAATGQGEARANRTAFGGVVIEARLGGPPANSALALRNGASHVSCPGNPDCRPTVQLGDDPKSVHDARGGP